MTSVARRALELLVESAGEVSPPARVLDVGVVGLGAGCGATTVARGLALELPGDEVSDGVAPGPAGVIVAVAGRSAVPVLAALVSERLAPHHACVILVANRPEDPDEWRDTGAICLPPSRLSVALLAHGRRARGPFGSALRNLASAVREAGAMTHAARAERGQALLATLAALFVLVLGASLMFALGRALAGKGETQQAADLAALSAARSMRDDLDRLYEPPLIDGRPNPYHLSEAAYLARARAAALEAARANGVRLRPGAVRFPGAGGTPTRVKVIAHGRVPVRAPGKRRAGVGVEGVAVAELAAPAGDGPALEASGGGYSGPLAYRQGKPMRPDVARAFDRMEAAAGADGLHLIVTSGYRSDAEQAELFERHPDPKWVAPPGKSLHRLGTELDLGPPAAYGWLARNAGRFHFTKRYSWEPWHYGYTINPRSTPPAYAGAGRPGDGRSAVPGFVPPAYRDAIARAATRWNVSAALLAAQLYAESGFNPSAISPAGARGIAQFMPGTARSYGLADPFDARAAIAAQGHLMRDLLRQFGSVSLALAAYNAGPAPVARCGCVPPYPETRAYVVRVLALMGSAGDLLPGDPSMEVRLVS